MSDGSDKETASNNPNDVPSGEQGSSNKDDGHREASDNGSLHANTDSGEVQQGVQGSAEKREAGGRGSLKAPVVIDVNESGLITPKNANQLASLAKQLLEGRGVPKGYTSVAQIVSAWNFAASLNLAPQPALRNIAVIEGTPSLFGDLPLGLARKSGQLEFFDEYVFDKDYKNISFENKNLTAEIFGAVCFMQRKGFDKKSFTFTVEDAKRAGLWGKTSSSGAKMPWSAYPQIMLVRRARSMAIKSEFGDMLSGAAIAEFDFNALPDMREVSETSSANILNDRFKSVPASDPEVGTAPGIGEGQTSPTLSKES